MWLLESRLDTFNCIYCIFKWVLTDVLINHFIISYSMWGINKRVESCFYFSKKVAKTFSLRKLKTLPCSLELVHAQSVKVWKLLRVHKESKVFVSVKEVECIFFFLLLLFFFVMLTTSQMYNIDKHKYRKYTRALPICNTDG